MKNNSTIKEIMEAFRQNPEKGFELIYKAYSGPVFRYLRNSFSLSREETEDILQNIFLPWVKNPQKYAQIENPGAYLFISARNAALKFKETIREDSLMTEGGDKSHDTSVETNLMIDRALCKLPHEQKEAVVLKVWINMTFEEIASLQQCSLQTVASRYRYAISKLKELIPWQK
ncbi:MAG: RNA polymerase sigma factor [Candidatus Riflebacteria bacterium]|nr:RNA polymerase sigma factor [Candidatus Riflebacteria bacterium]